jgi:hypothetical protein
MHFPFLVTKKGKSCFKDYSSSRSSRLPRTIHFCGYGKRQTSAFLFSQSSRFVLYLFFATMALSNVRTDKFSLGKMLDGSKVKIPTLLSVFSRRDTGSAYIE